MHSPGTGRIACALCTLLLLTACGGGGGGGGAPSTGTPPPTGGGNPPSGQLPTFAATTTPLVFSAPIPNRTPDSQRITVSISGNTSGKLYVVASDSDPSVVRTTVSSVNQSGATPTVDIFVDPVATPTFLRAFDSSTIESAAAVTRSATITLTACVNDDTCQTGQLPGSPQTVNVTYTVASAVQGDVIGPRVVTAGTAGSVYLRGRDLGTATQVSFGNTAATAVTARSNGTQVFASYPALAAGTYPVTINAGAIAFSASLVVVPATNYSATQLTYPSSPQEIGGVLYDPQRQVLYVAARYSNSQNNTLFKFQFSNGAWQAPLSATVPSLQDVALSADGSMVLALTDNSLVEFNADSFASVGTYLPDDTLVRSGTAYMQNIAVANDGYAIITTGGANPSNTLLYSSLTHAFFSINSAGSNLSNVSVDPRLYFGNPGVSPDGALVFITQDPRTAAEPPPIFIQPAPYFYWAANQRRSTYFGSPSTTYTDKDRSQQPRSARPAVNNISGQADGLRIIVNGPKTVVVGSNLSPRGLLPEATRAAAIKPDGSRAYVFVATDAMNNGELRSYDLDTKPSSPERLHDQVGAGIPMSLGATTGANAIAITPDGNAVFVAGVAGVFVQPVGVF